MSMTDRRYIPTTWGAMPMGVRKAWLRLTRALPAYDLSITRGWEEFQAKADRDHVYITNRSGDWYMADDRNYI